MLLLACVREQSMGLPREVSSSPMVSMLMGSNSGAQFAAGGVQANVGSLRSSQRMRRPKHHPFLPRAESSTERPSAIHDARALQCQPQSLSFTWPAVISCFFPILS